MDMCPLGPLMSGPCSPRPCVTGFLPCAVSSRFICAAAGVRTPFLSKAESNRTASVDHTWSTIHLSMDARCFHVLPGVTVAAVKVVCGCLCETVFGFSWVNTSLDRVVLFVEKPLSCPPWRLHHCIDTPANSARGPQFHYLIDTSYFLCFLLFYAAILMGVKSYFFVVFTCVSLMIRDVEHLFVCSICVSFLEKCLFLSFAHLKVFSLAVEF